MFGIFKKDEVKPSLDLTKRQETFKICLEKKAPQLTNDKFAVEINMDKSGSMSDEYECGLVSEVVERLMPIGLQFDDNGSMGFHFFTRSLYEMKDVTIKNYKTFIADNMNKVSYGGTSYAPFVRKMIDKYKNNTIDKPVLCIMITDGDCDDEYEMKNAIKESAKYPIFFKFIGIGNNRFNFLEELDNLKGSPVDNADFKAIKDIKNTSDTELYNMILDELENWKSEYKKVF